MTTVAVAAATGNVGRRLVERLTRDGVQVRAFTRDAPRARTLLPASVEVVDAPTPQPGGLDGCRALFVACGNGPQRAEVEEALIREGAAEECHIVKLSSVGAALEKASLHRQLELMVESLSGSWVHIRPSMFMQSLLTLAEQGLRDNDVIRLPLGDAEISAVDIRDIADAAAVALLDDEHLNGVRTVAGRPISMDAAAALIASRLGRPVRYASISDDAAAHTWRAAGLDTGTVTMLVSIFATLRTGEPTVIEETNTATRDWGDAAAEMDINVAWRDMNLVPVAP